MDPSSPGTSVVRSEDERASSKSEMNKLIDEKVIEKSLQKSSSGPIAAQFQRQGPRWGLQASRGRRQASI